MLVLSPTEKRVNRLAILDVDAENSDALTLFWKTFNKMLTDYQGNDYKFNPRGFVVDENPANWIPLESVFGTAIIKKTVYCEFHFQQCLQKHAKKYTDSSTFFDLGKEMLYANTEFTYSQAHTAMSTFIRSQDGAERNICWLK